MRKRWRFAFYMALLGFISNAALFGFVELSNYAPLNPMLGIMADILCPASILGAYPFFDINAHSGLMIAAWTFLGLLNSTIYFGVGLLVGSFLWKSDECVIKEFASKRG